MPIDPSIISQLRPVQLDNPMDVQGKALTLRSLAGQQQMQDMQLKQAQHNQDQERTLADLYKNNLSPDGKINRQGLLSSAAQSGLGNRIPGLQKQFADTDKASADAAHVGAQTNESQFKVQKQKLDIAGSAISSLLSNPNVTHDDVIQTVNQLVQQGIIQPEQGAQMARTLPGNPGMLRQFLMQKGLETMEASKRMEMMTPKFEKVDNGGAIQTGTVNPMTGQFSAGQAIRKVASPDTMMREAGDERRSVRSDTRERSLAAQGVTYQQDANGNLVALPTKGVPGAAVTGGVVRGPNGQPLAGKSNVTEDQAKAAGWLAQANNAWKNMQAAMEGNPGAAQPGLPDAVAAIPSFGIGAAVGNTMRGKDRQKFVQGASSLSEALLRAATGAGVNKDEAKQKLEELTPVFGESDETTKQKMAAIPVYLESLKTRAGHAGKNVPTSGATGGWGALDVPDDIAAILKKHGG